MKRLFELDAAVADADLGIGLLWKELEVTAIDGTTMELRAMTCWPASSAPRLTARDRC